MKKTVLFSLTTIALALPLLSKSNDFNVAKADYAQEYTDNTKYIDDAQKVSIEISNEGFTLLKNKNNYLPIKKDSKISVLGKNSVRIANGGQGSGAGFIQKGCIGCSMEKSLEDSGFIVNPNLLEFYKNDSKSGGGRTSGSSSWSSVSGQVSGETPLANYNDVLIASFDEYNDAAIIVITREGHEGADINTINSKESLKDPYSEKHFLELSDNELELLSLAKEHFENIIYIINSSNIFECDLLEKEDKVKSIVWIGNPGGISLASLGKILNGEINPSGRTVDTWARDFTKDPTFQNFGNNRQHGKYVENLNYGNGLQNIPSDTMFNSDGSPVKSLGTYYGDPEWLSEEYKIVKPGLNGVRPGSFIEYEEGIYSDYRYYETRYADMALKNKNEAEEWYKGQEGVVYPFGYGLSYTTFSQEIVGAYPSNNSVLTENTKQVALKVKVTNIGSVAGKEVVQGYWKAPYKAGEIEKADHVLCSFEKTKLLEPGSSQIVTLTFDLQDVANYDYSDANKNGFKGYELDPGNYSFGIYKNAHTLISEIKYKIGKEGIKYLKDKITGNDVINRFSNNDVFNTLPTEKDINFTHMSRSDFAATFPKYPSLQDRFLKEGSKVEEYLNHGFEISELYKEKNFDFIPEEAMVTKDDAIKNGWKQNAEALSKTYRTPLSEITEVNIEDPKWESFINEFTYKELEDILTMNVFSHCDTLDKIGVEGISEKDEPALFGIIWWPSAPIIAATFNKDLIYRQGEMIAEESTLCGKSGWWGPFAEIHRSPFAGRNFEMYSADPYLAGKICSELIRAVTNKGVYVYVKDFAAYNQETNREGGIVYISEQALREMYLKPYQMVVQEGHTNGILTSYNRLGLVETGGNYRLLTNVLKEEWGFKGIVMPEMTHTGSASFFQKYYENFEFRILAGNDAAFDQNGVTINQVKWSETAFDGKGAPIVEKEGETFESYLWWGKVRESVKTKLYTFANSRFFVDKYISTTTMLGFGDACESELNVILNNNVNVNINGNLDYFKRNNPTATGYKISLDSNGKLPNGITFENGVLKGQALEAGKFRITVTATYFSGETAIDTRIQNLVINVGIPDGGIPTHSNNTLLIVGISCGCIVLVGAFVACLYILKKKKK